MAYKCVHCDEVYEDGSEQILKGCSNCSSKFFFYIKKEKLKEILENRETMPDLSAEEKKKMEKDVREIVGIKEEDTPVFLDFESVKVIKPGKYLLDLGKLFDIKQPKIYKLEDGKYIIDLSSLHKEDI